MGSAAAPLRGSATGISVSATQAVLGLSCGENEISVEAFYFHLAAC